MYVYMYITELGRLFRWDHHLKWSLLIFFFFQFYVLYTIINSESLNSALAGQYSADPMSRVYEKYYNIIIIIIIKKYYNDTAKREPNVVVTTATTVLL